MGVFRIHDLEFKVESARLIHKKSRHGLGIGIFVRAKKQKIQDHSWEPKADIENVGFRIQSVSELCGKRFKLMKSYLGLFGSYPQTLCVFSHNDIRNSTLEFPTVTDTTVRVIWTAKCDVFFSEHYGKNLDLYVDAECAVDLSNYSDEPSTYAKSA